MKYVLRGVCKDFLLFSTSSASTPGPYPRVAFSMWALIYLFVGLFAALRLEAFTNALENDFKGLVKSLRKNFSLELNWAFCALIRRRIVFVLFNRLLSQRSKAATATGKAVSPLSFLDLYAIAIMINWNRVSLRNADPFCWDAVGIEKLIAM